LFNLLFWKDKPFSFQVQGNLHKVKYTTFVNIVMLEISKEKKKFIKGIFKWLSINELVSKTVTQAKCNYDSY